MKNNDDMPDDIHALRAKYIHSEAERMRLRHLNSALRKQIEDNSRPNSTELSLLLGSFLPSDERRMNSTHEPGALWKNFASNNAGINKRYRIYIGWLYENIGWNVDYSCGKNLISRKDNRIIITLPESVATIDLENMYSLLGVAMEYKLDNVPKIVSAICITSSTLISRVKNLVHKFNITVRENFYFRNFPCVRCKADIRGQRVYYVPDNEEYLSVHINLDVGDKYCRSAREAESMNFKPPY